MTYFRSATKPFHATGIVIVKKSVRVQIAGKIKDKLALLGSSNGVNGDADEGEPSRVSEDRANSC